MKRSVIVTLMCSLCFTAAADWFEATGQALIERGDTTSARQSAIDDAVKRAALAAGARISSNQQLINGVLQNEQLAVAAEGNIKQLQLMSEQLSGNLLTVTVRVNIEPRQSACEGNLYRKPLLLSEIRLQARQDAIYGQLFQLGSDATTQLERHLRDYSPAALVTSAGQTIDDSALAYPHGERLFQSGQQYLLSANINDLSLGEQTNRFWQSAEKQRFFAIDVQLFDIFEQRLLYRQEYRTSAGWPYKSNDTPASHSQAFWLLPYGSKIDRLLQAIAEDVQQQLQCQPLLSSIKQTDNNQIMLELGTDHGLQLGDQLQVYQLQRHPTTPGVKQLLRDPITVSITNISSQHAWATEPKERLIQQIRQGDIVSVRKISSY